MRSYHSMRPSKENPIYPNPLLPWSDLAYDTDQASHPLFAAKESRDQYASRPNNESGEPGGEQDGS